MARLLANSTSSGLTPPTLAALFGPLLFGLGAGIGSSLSSFNPTATANAGSGGSFHAAYAGYLRSCHATEHLLLSFVRLQVSQIPHGSAPPRRLVSWVQGYPSMVTPLEGFEKPRRGVKCVRVGSVRRNVRMYERDLVRTCVGWASGRGAEGREVRESRIWGRIAPVVKGTERMPAKYSEGFRKRMDLPLHFQPGVPTDTTSSTSSTTSTPALSTSSSTASSTGGGTTKSSSSSFLDELDFGSGGLDDRFGSLTELKWGRFEEVGFGKGEGETKKRLEFDLNESKRAVSVYFFTFSLFLLPFFKKIRCWVILHFRFVRD